MLIFCASSVLADGYVLESVGGSLNYGYSYARSQKAEAESNSIGFHLSTSAYIWQPWFMTHSIGAGVSFSTATTKGVGKSTSKSLTGDTELNIFPVSRFPSYLAYGRSDSVSDNFTGNITDNFTGRHFINTRLMFRQSYIGEDNLFASLNFIKSENKGEGLDSESRNVGLRVRKRSQNHNLEGHLAYSTNRSDGSDSVPEQYTATVAHAYQPGTSVSISNSANYHQTRNSTSLGPSGKTSEGTQVSSYFSWRPDYKPVSISGGARIASNSRYDGSNPEIRSNDYGANIGAHFQLSTRARINALASASAGETEGLQHSNNSVSGSYSFTSDQYLLGGFNYNWGFNAAASRTSTTQENPDPETTVETSTGTGFTHQANRNWLVGRASSLGVSFSQGFSLAWSGESQGDGSVSHSVSSSLSTRGLRGTTFLSLAASDSRNVTIESLKDQNQDNQEDAPVSQFQNISLSLSRSYLINRFSTMNGDISYSSSRVHSNFNNNQQVEVNSTSRGALHYQHSRIFSIYGMSLVSDLSYNHTESKEGVGSEDIYFVNKINYTIGKLSLSLDLTTAKTAGSTPRYNLFFRATRSF